MCTEDTYVLTQAYTFTREMIEGGSEKSTIKSGENGPARPAMAREGVRVLTHLDQSQRDLF